MNKLHITPETAGALLTPSCLCNIFVNTTQPQILIRNYWTTMAQRILLLIVLAGLLLSACGGSDSPVLGIAGKPTVVFVYTDG